MTADEEAVSSIRVVRCEPAVDLAGQVGDILRVVEDRHMFAVIVRLDMLEPFEHFEAFEDYGSSGAGSSRKERSPDRMRVQDRAYFGATPGDDNVQKSFGRRSVRCGAHRLTVGIDQHEVVLFETAFVFAAGGNEESKGIT